MKRTLFFSFLIFACTLTVYTFPLGNRPFFTRGEAREAMVVDEMVDRDNLILPLQEREELLYVQTKPPMFHWLGVATSWFLSGVSETTIRFPSALAGALILAMMFAFVARSASREMALLTAAILAGTFEWSRSSGNARVDMVFVLGITGSMLSLFSLIEQWHKKNSVSWLLLLCTSLCVAFAVLAKGPFGLILPWSVASLYLLIVNRGNLTSLLFRLPWFRALGCIAVSVIIAGAWYVAAYLQGGENFLQLHFFNENMGRFVDLAEADAGHEKPFYFSFIYLAITLFPFSLFLPLAAVWVWRKRTELLSEEHRLTLFCLLWLGVLFLTVTLCVSKRDVYLLPAFPAIAYLMALMLADQNHKVAVSHYSKKFALLGTGFLALVILSTSILTALFLVTDMENFIINKTSGDSRIIAENMLRVFGSNPLVALSIMLSASLLVSAWTVLGRERYVTSALRLCCGMVLLGGIVNTYVLPAVATESTPVEFMESVRTKIPPSMPLFQYKHFFFPAMYYSGAYIERMKTLDEKPEVPEFYLLVRKGDFQEVTSTRDDDWVILESANDSANGKDRLLLVKYRRKAS